LLGVTLIVIVVAQTPASEVCDPGSCERDALVVAFEQAARRVLGNDAQVTTELTATDPPDEQTAARQGADGVVELSFTPDGSRARIHGFVPREQRWLDREISFGESRGGRHRETLERGRLLGFAVASMFTTDPELSATPLVDSPAPAPPPPTSRPSTVPGREHPGTEQPARTGRSIEFAGIASSGLNGTAAGLGASAGLRLAFNGPLRARLFVAGRTGNIPQAQATTRTALLGGGLALALLPDASPLELGARVDAFASYFDASHLSEDDIEPDRRSRWQVGADVVAEGGFRVAGGAGVLVGLGLEGMLGKTEIYTHGNRVAVVPHFRAIAELGFRTRF
jgi:hypothetical protein